MLEYLGPTIHRSINFTPKTKSHSSFKLEIFSNVFILFSQVFESHLVRLYNNGHAAASSSSSFAQLNRIEPISPFPLLSSFHFISLTFSGKVPAVTLISQTNERMKERTVTHNMSGQTTFLDKKDCERERESVRE